MALIKPSEGSFADVPDKYVPIAIGIRTFKVLESKVVASDNPETLAKNPSAQNLIVVFECQDDDDNKGKKSTKYISTKMATEIKRLALSCGLDRVKIENEGVDTDLLVGCNCRGVVKANTYKDKTTGAMKENTQIAEYLIPGDQGYSS